MKVFRARTNNNEEVLCAITSFRVMIDRDTVIYGRR